MKKAVVIGSGFGGLASAVRLIRKGYEVTVLEARDQIGGRAGVFKEQGFIFDAGPTVITAPYLLNELFEMLGEDPKEFFTLLPIDPFYRIQFYDGSTFDYVGDEERLIDNIQRLSPRDVDGYRKLAKHARDIFDVGYTQLADEPFDTFVSMLRAAPDMIRLQNYRSVYSLVSKYIEDPRLRQAFSFEPLLVGGNPTKITSIYLLIHWLERKWGVHFVKGGTTALVQAFDKLLKRHGAQVLTNASVERIETRGDKVKRVWTREGRCYEADVVVSNADPVRVYRDMLPEHHRRKHSNGALSRKTHSMSLFVAYFGTKKLYPELAHHTILLGPRYQGLLGDIFDRKVLADDFSLYLHAPTRTDPGMAPEGHEAFYVLSPVPNNKSSINWQYEGERYKEKIYRFLEERALPGLAENLTVDFHVDPNYFEQDLQSEHGAAFGIEPSFRQSAYFRFHNQSEDFENLYFVGANTHPGAGVPGVLCSAKVLEKIIPESRALS
ncbi:phytoene desaturase [Pseudobacteriovorax antillogorgiicola]|uniref:Phytoene desaturase n=1 Tax=Pseudobacteriovorax antillogorgiicola TaxID=1513793 RepID=A0A1Y6BHM2_9BACT|nr:phytoene desaturase [Pseudobacteriovorax antillogorgiicola]TCS55480.1 phytoene desaturase [Pseudobacteriovorax antillogorgiicola]SMF11936.1 phytoene desaturase [Pseudobacteriovorax antillogorgiicola]